MEHLFSPAPPKMGVKRITSIWLILALQVHLVATATASSWDPVLLVNTESFQIIDDGDGSTDIALQFGDSAAETLSWATTSFVFTDDLEVQGDLNIDGAMSGQSLFVWGTNNTEPILMTDTTSDHVGINTGSPDVELEVHNATGQSSIEISTNVDVGAGNTTSLIFESDADGVSNPAVIGQFLDGSLRFSGQGNIVIPDMVVEDSGNVGINTTDPEAELDVVGTISGDALVIAGATVLNEGGEDNDTRIEGATDENLVFMDASTDLVGIGTNVPDRKLTIQGNGGASEWISFKDNTGTSQWHFNYLGDGFNFVETGVLDGRFYLEDGGNVGINTTDPDSQFDIQNVGEVAEVGNGTANDIFINFDDGTDRNLGWDDSEGAFSTFDQELRFRTRQGATVPVVCSATVAGMQWMDTDTGIIYNCDTSNGRNKWLSIGTTQLSGGETQVCNALDAQTVEACTMDIHNGTNANDMGWQVPADLTIVGGGFHSDSSCTDGLGVDLEVADGENGGVAELADILSGCTDANGCTSFDDNIDIDADDVIRLRLDNNCATGGVNDWSAYLIFRWRHD